MSTHSLHGGRRRLLAAAAVVLAVAGVLIVVLGLRGAGADPLVQPPRTVADTSRAAPAAEQDAAAAQDIAPQQDTAAQQDGAAGSEPGSGAPVPDPAADAVQAPDLGPIMPASEPVGIQIPSIGVDEEVLERLEVGPDGVLAAPVDFDLAGWHTRGPRPGTLGPAVIAGHVDQPGGPAVFFKLGELVPGDVVRVPRQDGTVATFVIDSVERFAKAEFPTSRVYGNTTDRAEIRLITCGGAFDRTTGHYVDNIVAFGHLV